MRSSTFIALIVIVAIGCSSPAGSAAPSDTSPPLPSPSTATASNSAPVSAEPSAPATSTPISPSPSTASAPTDLARIAVKERDNIRVEVELQRNPLPAGEPSWVKVRVTNKGRTNVTWFHDGCAEPVWVHGVSEVAWSMGEETGRQAWMFKTYALGGQHRCAAGSPRGDVIRREGAPAHRADRLRGPRDRRDDQARQDASSHPMVVRVHRSEPRTPCRRSGDVPRVRWLLLARQESQQTSRTRPSSSKLDAWIISDAAAARLSPAQAVDAALSDPDLRHLHQTRRPSRTDVPEIAWYDADRDLWEIGVMPWYETEPPRIHGVLVDAVTGRILGPLDRPWDHEVDPFP